MESPASRLVGGVDHVPVEVFDSIFGFVRLEDEQSRTNKRALFSCSRVSKAWHALTLRHRFHSVSLYARTGNSFERRVRKNCFLQDFLVSPLFPTVQCYIQRLTLRWGIADLDPYIGADLSEYLASFPALRSLKLRGLLGRHISAPSHPNVPALDSLSIEGWVCHARAHDPKGLCDLLRCFASIGELYLEDLCHWLPADDLEVTTDDHPPVSSLVLRDSTCPHPVCDILESAIAHEKPLRRLDVRALSSTDTRGGIDLLESFARTIEDFKCTVTSGSDTVSSTGDVPPAFDFSALPHLRTLTVAVEVPLSRTRARSLAGGEDLDKSAPWARLVASLHTLAARPRSSSLKLLHLQLAPARALTDKAQTVDALQEALRRNDASMRALEDALLALVRERGVQLVQVALCAAPPASGLRGACVQRCDDFVLGLFPRLRQTGVLRV